MPAVRCRTAWCRSGASAPYDGNPAFPEGFLLMAVRFPEKEGVRYHDGGQVFGPEIEVMRKVDAPTFDVRRIETDGRQEGPPMFLNCPSPPAAVPFADDGGEVPCARIQGTHAVREAHR